jgi:hypothetical protein
MEGSMKGIFHKRNAWGTCNSIILGGFVSWIGGKNIK